MELKDLKLAPQTDESLVCAFTGNRPNKLPWGTDERDERCVRIKEKIAEVIEEQYARGKRLFVCGMARGADTYFAEAAIKFRETHQCLMLEAAIPFRGQSDGWLVNDRIRYDRIIDACDCVTVVCRNPSRWAPLERNEYMVDKASTIIALSYSGSGGTVYTINAAKRKKREIIVINE